jgi:hypothetical protein
MSNEQTNPECPQNGHRCPKCGDNNKIVQSTVHGHLTCLACGYCAAESVFKLLQLDKYVLHVEEPMNAVLYKQFGVPYQRVLLLMDKIVEVIRSNRKENSDLYLVSAGKVLKEVALHCETAEELVIMAIMYNSYIQKIVMQPTISASPIRSN